MSFTRIEEIEARNKEIALLIERAERNGDASRFELKKELYQNKIEIINLITIDEQRAGITASQLIDLVEAMPHQTKYSIGINAIDRQLASWEDKQMGIVGGFETGTFVNLAGESGAGKCVDGETEFLSPNGWVKIKDYKGEKVARFQSDGTVTFINPKLYYVSKTDKFYHCKTTQIDMMVTESHRIPYLTSKGNLNKKTFKELYESNKIYKARMINSFNLDKPIGLNLSDDEIRLSIAIYADATKARNQWRIRLKKDRKKVRLEMLLNKIGIEYKKLNYGNIEGFNDYLFYFDKCSKDMTELYGCSSDQLKVVVDEFVNWDGSYRKNSKAFYTSIKEHADFIQYAISSCGYVSTICKNNRIGFKQGKYTRKSVEYIVTQLQWSNTTMSSRSIKREDIITEFDGGLCYCFTMGDCEDNDMWVARRNDYVFVTGNTTLTIDILANVSRYSKTVFFNHEMGLRRIASRLKRRLTEKTQRDNMIIDSSTDKIDDLVMEITLYARDGIKFFVIDSRMKIKAQGDSDVQKNADISHKLSKVAREKDIIVILINQMSESDIKEKRLALKGGGDQKYDSDMTLFYIKDEKDLSKRKLVCTKNRTGDENLWSVELSIRDGITCGVDNAVEIVYEEKKIEVGFVL